MKGALRRLRSLVLDQSLEWLATPSASRLLLDPCFRLMGRRRGGHRLDLARVKSVLVVRLDEVGDIVLTAPFLRELRRNLPEAWITLVVKPGTYNLVERCPYVNEVLKYNPNAPPGPHVELHRHRSALRFASQHLWPRRFDLAILPRWDIDYYHASFLAYFSGARWRVGYSERVSEHKQQKNAGTDILLTHPLDGCALRHEVERDLEVVRFITGRVQENRLELWLGEEDEEFANGLFRRTRIEREEMIIGFGPAGGSSPLKQWPVSRFIELGRWLQANYRARILVVGGTGEEALSREIEGALGPSTINTVSPCTLRQMAALLKRCHLYVGNDAGPMHLAAAAGVPVVGLFGSSCHHRFAPWGERHTTLWSELPCSPCLKANHFARCEQCIFDHPRCMWEITLEEVKEAVARQLSIDSKENMKQTKRDDGTNGNNGTNGKD
jgi:lipopolysaccharide heptosyltransferase II